MTIYSDKKCRNIVIQQPNIYFIVVISLICNSAHLRRTRIKSSYKKEACFVEEEKSIKYRSEEGKRKRRD